VLLKVHMHVCSQYYYLQQEIKKIQHWGGFQWRNAHTKFLQIPSKFLKLKHADRHIFLSVSFRFMEIVRRIHKKEVWLETGLFYSYDRIPVDIYLS
jgi:hypothetical protein